jgi:hypothetical protein
MYGQVAAGLSATSQSGTVQVPQGKQGEILDAKLHGDFYSAAYYGNLFQATTLVAGTVIPVQATNLVSTFTIWNPLGSGVNVEMVRYSFAQTTTVQVVGPIALWIQTAVGGANVVPASLTALSVRPALWSSTSINPIASNKAGVYSAATLVNTMATNMWQGPVLWGAGAVTDSSTAPRNYDFNGTTLLGPGTLATVAAFAAQTAATSQTFIWSEWPV